MSTDDTLYTKFGPYKLARYLLRSLEDLGDVCETINKLVQQSAAPSEIESVFKGIECWGMEVPNTVSSVIIGLNVPQSILEGQKYGKRNLKSTAISPNKIPLPHISYAKNVSCVSKRIKNFYDVYTLHAFLKEPTCTRPETLRIIAARKAARLLLRKADGQESNFILTVTYPGSLFMEIYREQEVARER